MKRVGRALGPAFGLLLAGAGSALAQEAWLVNVDLPVGVPLTDPQRARFHPGPLPSAGAYAAFSSRWFAGVKLRLGALLDGPGPSDPTLDDPGMGGLGALTAVGRVRPLAKPGDPVRAPGPWAELGGGPALTGSLVRLAGEAAVGWNFQRWGFVFGPSLRYVHVVQPSGGLDGSDAQLALVGIEVALWERSRKPVAAAPPPPRPVAAAPKTEPAPPADKDKDGIPDDEDKCPDDPEDKDGFEDEDGCPDDDNDKDGIADAGDKCPTEAEVVNGVDDQDGCPDQGLIELAENRIILSERVLFKTDRARVKTAARPALRAVIELWKQHPEWEKLVIEGHADVRGSDRYNQWLSEERARRVHRALIELGFPSDRLEAVAFGRKRPRDKGDSDEAHERNRRVEFVVVDKQGGSVATDGATKVK